VSLLTRYILKRFSFLALFTSMASLLVFITVDLMENLDKFIATETAAGVIVRYYLLYSPQILYLIFPVILLLTTIFSLGGLVKTSEITAMKASGISPGRIMRLLALVGAIASLVVFFMGETLVADTAAERMEIYRTNIKRKPANLRLNSGRIYFQNDENSMLTLENFNQARRAGYKAVYLRTEDGRLAERIDADSLLFRDTGWILKSGEQRQLIPARRHEAFSLMEIPQLNLNILDIEGLQSDPAEMNLQELNEFIARQEQAGARVQRWQVNAQAKLASPLANLVIIMFGVPIALRRSRAGIMLGFGLSLLSAFAYYGIQVVCQNFGYKGLLDPFSSAWIPNAIFVLLAFLLYLKLDR
jgi:lipopolysaccharide export system permease protein